MLSGEATKINCIVFGLFRHRIEPTMYRTWGEHAHHYTTDSILIETNIEDNYIDKIVH
jgi:hypothetical protein